MMVLERWMVAAIFVAGLACIAPGQSTPHHHKAKTPVVQPDNGAPPDQAVDPDASAPLAQTPNYDPPPPPPRPPDPDPPPAVVVTPVATPQEKPEPLKAEVVAPEPAPPTRPMTPEEQQLEKDSVRLLTLVRELKDEVAKAGIDTLSLSALRKADEIQRLSKNLKERLRLQSQVVPGKTQ